MILEHMISTVSVLVLRDRGTCVELKIGETNRKFSLLKLLLHLHMVKWHSDSKSHSKGATMTEESPFLCLLDVNSHV